MLVKEWDFDLEKQVAWEEGREEGWEEGREKGWEEGREKGWEEGREEGREEGIEEGIEKEKRKNAKAMKDNGIDLNTIATITGLPVGEIARM